MTELAQALLIAISLSPAPPEAGDLMNLCHPELARSGPDTYWPEDVPRALIELENEGLIDWWRQGSWLEDSRRYLVFLTPLACERLGVRITDELTYGKSHEGRRPAPRYDQADDWLDDLVDDGPGPDELAEAAEEAGRPTRDGPKPTFLVGQSLCPWPGPAEVAFVAQLEQPCLACGDKPLAPSAYCLVCDRWGMDRPHGGKRRRRRPCPNEGTIRPKLRAGREAALKRRGKRCPHA
jgi:hypothetical protein